MSASHAFGGNRLLSLLPEETLERWSPHLTPVELNLGQVLHEAGTPLRYAYFPATALTSLLQVMQDESMAEIAMVGPEGVVGMPLFLGGDSALGRCVVHGAGMAWRVPAPLVQRESESWSAVRVVLPFARALMAQMAQTAACNRHHTIDQQLSRWLLLSLERTSGDDLLVTQGRIADLLGVRREGVNAAAMRLQRAGIIRYSQGHICVLDRAALGRCACECYEAIRREYDTLLPSAMATYAPFSDLTSCR